MNHHNLKDSFLLFILFFIGLSAITSQESVDSFNRGNKLGLGSKSFIYAIDNEGIEYDTLIEDVKITQDSLFLFCDRAYVIDKAYVEAIGEVSVVQGDSIEIFADSLIFNDKNDLAHAYGEVIFRNNNKELHTTEAVYDINSKTVTYKKGATLYNEGTELISQTGIYDIDQKKAFFSGKVVVRDSSSILNSDSLNYDLAREMIYIISPTNIYTDSTAIYCEGGYFDYKSEQGKFYNNLQIITGSKSILADRVHYYAKEDKYKFSGYPVINDENSRAKADTIIYFDKENKVELIGNAYFKDADRELKSYRIDYNLDNDKYETRGRSEVIDENGRLLQADKLYRDKEGNDIAQSNVSLRDEKQATTLKGDRLVLNSENSEYKAFNNEGQPLLIKEFDTDSLFLKSDTLFYQNQDSIENFRGKENVQFLKGGISGRASNLSYLPQDSIYIFYGKPIMWSDSIQISGDTLKIIMSNANLASMEVVGNAFMIMQNSMGSFDQVKGDKIVNHFSENVLAKSVVEGNVEMVYFMYEDGSLEGVNHSLCGGLQFIFKNEEMDEIKFIDKPSSKFEKGEEVDIESNNLQGFVWEIKRKPNKQGLSRL